MKLFIKKLHESAIIPSYAYVTDAGLDLHTTESVVINPGERASIPTGIAMHIPDGCVGLVWDKSGLGIKQGLKVMGGVVDSGYRGEIIVGIHNLSSTAYTFDSGDKIAQMLIQRVEQPVIELADELDESDRGDNAFGSTGK